MLDLQVSGVVWSVSKLVLCGLEHGAIIHTLDNSGQTQHSLPVFGAQLHRLDNLLIFSPWWRLWSRTQWAPKAHWTSQCGQHSHHPAHCHSWWRLHWPSHSRTAPLILRCIFRMAQLLHSETTVSKTPLLPLSSIGQHMFSIHKSKGLGGRDTRCNPTSSSHVHPTSHQGVHSVTDTIQGW